MFAVLWALLDPVLGKTRLLLNDRALGVKRFGLSQETPTSALGCSSGSSAVFVGGDQGLPKTGSNRAQKTAKNVGDVWFFSCFFHVFPYATLFVFLFPKDVRV